MNIQEVQEAGSARAMRTQRIQRRNRNRRRRVRLMRLLILLVVVLGAVFIYARFSSGTVAVNTLRLRGYPASLLEMLEKYPETKEFVKSYSKYKDKEQTIDVSQEVTKGTVPYFCQWDTRWGYGTYGFDFIAVTACGPTCLSMVYSGLTGDTSYDPLHMAGMAEARDYYVEGAGTSWKLMDEGAEALGLDLIPVSMEAQDILRVLGQGYPMICSMKPGDFTYTGHFIVLKGLDADGNVLVNDPNSPKNSQRSWNVNDLVNQMKGAWAYGYQGVGLTP